MADMNINIHRIVLDGLSVSYHHQSTLKAALESELTRLIAAGIGSRGLQSSADLPSVMAGEIRNVDEADPVQLGQQIARAIHRGINQ